MDAIGVAYTYGVLDIDAVARDAWERGRPTEGEFAEYLWGASNHIPVADAEQMMRDAGYIPFEGYPLKRSGKKSAS
jgi:hypothetical protein